LIVAKIHASERQAFEEEIADLKEQRRRLQEDAGNREHEFARQLNDKDSYIKDLSM
jgi:hypothetical protein